MKAYTITHVGRVRTNNEDNVLAIQNASGDILIAVADGMGGHEAGEVASKMITDGLREAYSKLSNSLTSEDYRIFLENSLQEINNNILEKSNFINGMGSTIVTSIITKTGIITANIGDSGAYVISANEISKVSKDHTTVQRLVDLGKISANEAFNHPERHVLYQAVGREIKLNVYNHYQDIGDAKYVLLCSDGLSDLVTQEEIYSVMSDTRFNVEDKIRVLVQKAMDISGKDNISIAIVEL